MGRIRSTVPAATLVYIDETGSAGKGANKQPLLTLAAALVDEDKVQPLRQAFRAVAKEHLGAVPSDFELHGNEIWNGAGHWEGKSPPELIAVYKQAIGVLDDLDIPVSWASIHKSGRDAAFGDRFGLGRDRGLGGDPLLVLDGGQPAE